MDKRRIIWTNGCFDILHIGHIRMLEYGKSICDRLVVGIDSDRRVSELKGVGRPINNQSDRQEFLKSIKFVDEVVIFDDEESLVESIKKSGASHILVGEEYKSKGVIGAEIAEVIYFKRIEGYSTTSIITRDI